jgi:GAF domain-containing protein
MAELRDHDPALEAACVRAKGQIEQRRPLHEVLSLLATTVEALSPVPAVASILLLDRDGLLRNGASPNLPTDYLKAIDRLRPDPRVGTCASAAATGCSVFTQSFLDDDKWAELRHLPLAIGQKSAWSCPIKDAEGRVLGTFGTYFREERMPTEEEQGRVTALSVVAASAIAALSSTC